MRQPSATCTRPLAALLAACLCAVPVRGGQGQPPVVTGGPSFTDVTAAAGIRFRHMSGAFGKKYLPETLGSGVAFLDIDSDGWQDLLFVNSTKWPGRPGASGYPALYRNNRNGTFTDVTKASGLAVSFYGMGVAAADYDNDGHVDVYLTGIGPNRLFRNLGGGRFADVTARAGVGDPGFSSSAMWFDYDADGRLDLYVANYVEWSVEKDLFCTLDGKNKSYCTPESYKGQSSTLYRNRGDGTFENVTRQAGVFDPTSKALGVAMLDYNGDGAPDIFVANDTQPNRLFENRRNGTFTDVGMTAGVAFSEAGVARAGMGVDSADFDGSGRPGIVIGNFSNEMTALYSNEGNGLFIDEAPTSTIGRVSLLTLTFACFFFDYDLDGLPDILSVNGHVADDVNAVQPRVTYAQPATLFRNRGAKRFEDVTAATGPALQKPVVGRGAAYGDYDNDGDLDVVITANNEPARLLRNDGGNRNPVLRIAAVGTGSNRDGIGARVRVTLDNGTRRWSIVKTGSSYLSQSELPLTFGLGGAKKITGVEVTWPNGKVESVSGAMPGQFITLQEGKGVIRTSPIPARPGSK
ncbi:MAG TPA: CRTAC1 family protein [Vicinamibacterales bacterium]|nr:CRTAC1 family protein [Vicinamibacterales bacterium]